MPLIGFQPRFAALVESGKKTQTIRAPRKVPIRVGDRLYLWTGLRTKKARKLGEGIVESVERIEFSEDGTGRILRTGSRRLWRRLRHAPFAHSIAVADGFENYADMLDWFEHTHGLPFRGVLVRWRLA